MPTTPVEKPTFSFEGTVVKVRAAAMKGVSVDDRTAVVRVDHILEAPADFVPFLGHDITLRLGGGERVKAGQRKVFHTVGWMFGDGLAVRSVGSTPLPQRAGAVRAAGLADDPVARRATRAAEDRLKAANLVVSGRVIAVEVPRSKVATRRLRAGALKASPMHRPLSEHDPKWRDAVVEVDDVLKGVKQKRRIVVRFPASRDVRWYKAPKFRGGERGVFLLHKPSPVGAARTVARRAGGQQVFMALHPADFHPPDRVERIRAAIAAVGGTKRPRAPRRRTRAKVTRNVRKGRYGSQRHK